MRHAQPTWVEEDKSVLDPALSPLGLQQAEHLAALARAWRRPVDLVISPTRRTRQTAEPLARALEVEPQLAPHLEEIRLPPTWDGAPADEISAAMRAAKARSLAEWWDGFPGGEAFRDFHHRVTTQLVELLEARGVHLARVEGEIRIWNVEDKDRRVVIVGHGGTNAVAVGFLLGIEPVPWAWERFVSHHASITRLKATTLLGGALFGLREHSDVGHLPEPLRTR